MRKKRKRKKGKKRKKEQITRRNHWYTNYKEKKRILNPKINYTNATNTKSTNFKKKKINHRNMRKKEEKY